MAKLIHSKLELDQSTFFWKNFLVTTTVEFHHKKKGSAMIKPKDVFGKNEPSCHISMKKNETQTIIASFMSLGYNRVPNNLYFPL
jgi:hypothetical protein